MESYTPTVKILHFVVDNDKRLETVSYGLYDVNIYVKLIWYEDFNQASLNVTFECAGDDDSGASYDFAAKACCIFEAFPNDLVLSRLMTITRISIEEMKEQLDTYTNERNDIRFWPSQFFSRISDNILEQSLTDELNRIFPDVDSRF